MNRLIANSITLVLSGLISAAALADGHSAAKAYIVSPSNGETVSTTFTVIFGLKGMGVSPAGIEKENTGHHHLLIDMESLPPLDQPLGAEVKHFGGGQTETTLTLSPGKHTLQLILGDHLHKPHNPPVVSDPITIEVK
ncbi:DUF4399 domain-containing protein [Pontibacterium sp. N1Y112]|uniref:DUF4399 domain-containing protein n=1 Tax=Pontibacterium sinense TaxID=2781979 RepID=A0A8J7FC66_9GAMM|nr:DUF4399 domain-containing protein [Pontibacterium sinense]MBE9397387.1 DUF4399 domain-containing protein [Pontibacterium sinense]